MIPYLLTGTALWLTVLLTREGFQAKFASWFCLSIMIIFTGLRYEIGYDWLGYENYFFWLQPDFSFRNYLTSQYVLPVEYLYFVLNVLVKKLGGGIEVLFFLISAFNLIVIDFISGKMDSTSRPFVWFGYFCLALVMVQFNIIRQSVASSFVLISLFLATRGRVYVSILSLFAAVGFHTSTLMFAPVVLLAKWRIKGKYILFSLGIFFSIVILALVMGGNSNSLIGNVLGVMSSLLPGEISNKTDGYANTISAGNVWGISPISIILIFAYLFMLNIFRKMPDNSEINVAIFLTVMILFAHIVLGQVPIFWNRIMCVSLPWQLIILWKYYIRRISPGFRYAGLGIGGGVMLLFTAFQLNRPENIAFVPYHSLVQVWLFNDKGDGRVRSMYAVEQGQIEQARAAR